MLVSTVKHLPIDKQYSYNFFSKKFLPSNLNSDNFFVLKVVKVRKNLKNRSKIPILLQQKKTKTKTNQSGLMNYKNKAFH